MTNKNIRSNIEDTILDFAESIKRSDLWLHLAWVDVQQRYRGTFLGPFWITLSMLIFTMALSVVYTKLFHQSMSTLLPFLTSGILIWTFFSTVLSESADIFLNAKSFIDNIRLPFVLFVLRLIVKNQIILLHNIVVFILVAIFYHVQVNSNTLLFFPGFLLVSLILLSLSLLIGLIGARFRDLGPIIASCIMVVFFVSPITWQANLMDPNSLIIKLNPIYYIFDIVRSPLLGQAPNLFSWFFCLGFLAVTSLIAFFVFGKFRFRIPFWI